MMIRVRRPTLLFRLFTAIVSLGLIVAPALGAEVDEAEPTQVGWITVVVALLLVIAVGIGCFMNPKRTHQD